MELPPSPSRSSLIPPTDASLPVQVRGYRVVKRLATGGTSDVLLARAEGPHGFERPVVLKVLLQQFRDSEEFVGMFAREAAAYARLSHPAIVKLYDFFSEADELVMVLEYVDGLPLNKLRALLQTQGRALDDAAALFIAWRIFGALGAAHAAKDPQSAQFSPVIHRDVNPSNVLLPWDGHVKIADFGIAKLAGMDGGTKTGLIKGTYGYMAPEQVRGEALTARADVYAASLVLWELLAHRKAVVCGSASDLAVLRAMAEPSFPPLAALRPELPKPLLGAIARGLTPDAEHRDISAEDFCHALRGSVSLEEGREVLVAALASVRPALAAADEIVAGTARLSTLRPTSDTVPTLSDAETTRAPDPPRRAPASPPPLGPRALQPPLSAQPPRVRAPPTRIPSREEAGEPRGTAKRTSSAPPPLPSSSPPSRGSDRPPTQAPRTSMAFAALAPASLPTLPPWPTAARAPSSNATAPRPMGPDRVVLHAPPAWSAVLARPSVETSQPIVASEERNASPFARPGSSRRDRRRWIALGAAVALLASGGLALLTWTRGHAEAPPTTRATQAPAATAPPPVAATEPTPSTDDVATPPTPTSSARMGNVTVPPSRGGHRVWIDGRLAGDAPVSIPVHCGPHVIRVGSRGPAQRVDVPCGGSVDVR